MEAIPVRVVPRSFGETRRRDAWYATPIAVFLGLGAFVVYATWAAFQNAHYTYGPYLSPFYAPEIWGDSPHAWFGPRPSDDRVFRCVKCAYVYTDDPDVDRSRCQQCGTLNEAIKF